MDNVTNLDEVILGIALLGPGFLIMYGRSRFVTGRMVSVASSAFEYLMLSSVYYAFAYPIFRSLGETSQWSLLVFLFLMPVILGLVLGVGTQKEFFRKLLGLVSLNPIHTSPTAWDYLFSNRSGYSWVVVNLNSGGRYYGVLGPNSLASSDLNRRDLFLENSCDCEFKFKEKDGRKRGIWISEGEIRSIEIVEDEQK